MTVSNVEDKGKLACTAVPGVAVLHAIAVPCSQCTHQGNTYTGVPPPHCNVSDHRHHQSMLVHHMRRERVQEGSGAGHRKRSYKNAHAHNQVRDVTQLWGTVRQVSQHLHHTTTRNASTCALKDVPRADCVHQRQVYEGAAPPRSCAQAWSRLESSH